MSTYTLKVRDERMYRGEQSLFGSLAGYYGDILLRARIRRDQYDNQCHAVVETWTRDGWTEVQHVPIDDLPINAHGPYGTSEAWRPVMQASLLTLCKLGLRILVKEAS
jgi:hypothetical protein